MVRVVAAVASEIPPGGSKRVTLKGRPIALFNQGGEFFALLDRCPHEGASLCKGARVGLTRAPEVGQYELTRAGEMVRCPWHGWEFDLRTGQSYCEPEKTAVRRFEVSLVGGAELAEGPYLAETFPVTVENDYLLVEL